MNQHIVKINSIKLITHDVLQIVTEKPQKHTFTPGQATEISINILSDEKEDGYAHGQITEGFLKVHISDYTKNVYICGPPPMMDKIEKQLDNLKIDKKLIIKEVF